RTWRRRLRPTANCSRIRRRRRSSAAALGSGRSTSTPTPIGRAGCSSSSESSPARPYSSSSESSPARPLGLVAELVQEVPQRDGLRERLAPLRRVAIVPALNEEESVTRVIDEIRAFDPGFEIVVVDDGSADRTAQVARARGAQVIRLPVNLGIGGPVQTGLPHAFEHDFDLAVRLDGDGQHDPRQLGAILDPVLAGEADIAVGSRFAGGSGYRSSRSRRIGIRVLAW